MVDRSIWSFASGRQPEECVQQHVGPKQGDIIRLDMNPAFPVDVAASVTALPFRDNSIDSISSNSLFEHVPHPHDILREAFRVLRAGGALRGKRLYRISAVKFLMEPAPRWQVGLRLSRTSLFGS